MTDRWIECECPKHGVDFDLDHEPLPGPDEMVYCTHCGGNHRLGDIAQFHVIETGRMSTLSQDEWRRIVQGAAA